MSPDYGTYRLVFEAPTDQITPGVEMTLPGEANLEQMLSLFESFLRASGYFFNGDLQIVDPEPAPEPENPWFYTANSPQGTGFVPFDQYGNFTVK